MKLMKVNTEGSFLLQLPSRFTEGPRIVCACSYKIYFYLQPFMKSVSFHDNSVTFHLLLCVIRVMASIWGFEKRNVELKICVNGLWENKIMFFFSPFIFN